MKAPEGLGATTSGTLRDHPQLPGQETESADQATFNEIYFQQVCTNGLRTTAEKQNIYVCECALVRVCLPGTIFPAPTSSTSDLALKTWAPIPPILWVEGLATGSLDPSVLSLGSCT